MSTTIEIKLDKKLFLNVVLVLAVLASIALAVELGVIAYSLQSGALCK